MTAQQVLFWRVVLICVAIIGIAVVASRGCSCGKRTTPPPAVESTPVEKVHTEPPAVPRNYPTLVEEPAPPAPIVATEPRPVPAPAMREVVTPTPASPINTTATGSLSKPGQNAGDRAVVSVNAVEFAFRWCPAGSFMMGSPENEVGRSDDEEWHRVTLTKGFWIQETEVTQGQWRAVTGYNPSIFDGNKLPVENVSWSECNEFCDAFGKKLNLSVSLPTEAQWEYACRAGTRGPYGISGSLDEIGWLTDDNEPYKTNEVGTKKPNAWGLYDMHGNAVEWCSGAYGEYRHDNKYRNGAAIDPVGQSHNYSNNNSVVRGGRGYKSAATRMPDDPSYRHYRSATRAPFDQSERHWSVGLRVVVVSK